MRFLRNAILAVGLMGLAGACGGKDKGAEEPATETAPPVEGETPADPAATPEEGMGEEGMGGEEAAPEEGGEGGENAW